jgi:hypothetical protein
MSEFEQNMLSEIESDERWLAGFSTPPASPALDERLNLAVAGELPCFSPLERRFRFRFWHGLVAAAACLVIAAWLGKSPVITRPTETHLQLADSDELPGTEVTEQQTASLVELDDNLTNLESWSQESPWDLEGDSLAEAIDAVYDDAVNGQAG